MQAGVRNGAYVIESLRVQCASLPPRKTPGRETHREIKARALRRIACTQACTTCACLCIMDML